MPVDSERLRIVIDVETLLGELDQLLFKLGELETALQATDDHTIDVDVRDGEVDALLAKLGASQVASVGAGRGGGSGAAAGAAGGSVSRNLNNVSRAASEASEGLFDMNLRMENVHNALAKMVPLLLVFIGALPALIGGLAALAGAAIAAASALGALTVFAGMGAALARGEGDMMQGFSDMWADVQESFMEAFRPLFEQLAPLFERGLRGLERFFEAVAAEGDHLVDLRDELIAFGGFLLDTIPSFLADVAKFADAASGALALIGEAIANIDIFEMLAEIFAETLPLLMQFGQEAATLIGHLYNLSLGFFAVTNGIITLVNWFLKLVSFIPGGLKTLGLLVGMLLSVWTATMILNSSLIALATKALATAGAAVLKWAVQLGGARVAAFTAAMANRGLAASLRLVAGAIAMTGVGALLVLFGTLAGGAAIASDKIDQATQSLKAFQSQRDSMTGGKNPYANPNLGPGDVTGASRFAGGGSVTVNVQGDADRDTVRTQLRNANYRLERPGRGR